jgi:hypothetical protein
VKTANKKDARHFLGGAGGRWRSLTRKRNICLVLSVLWRFSIYLLGYHQYGMSEQETRLTLELQNAVQVNSLRSSKRILLTKIQMNP